MSPSKGPQLFLRVTLPFLIFVAVGSLSIVAVLHSIYRHQSRSEFAALAEANAEFFRNVRVPATERFAEYLKGVLNLDVYFRPSPGTLVPTPTHHEEALRSLEPTHKIVALDANTEAVAVRVGDSALILVRETPSIGTLLLRPVTFGVLIVFWTLSVGLAWAVTHWIVRPYVQTLEKLAQTERLVLLGKMATALAHEIQNPVAAIRLHAQLLESSAPDTAGLIVHEAAGIESLVNQGMFLARPEPPQTNEVEIETLLMQQLRAIQPQADYARVRVDLKTEPNILVQADARRLSQVFRNIMLNAIQAMPKGGVLSISMRGRIVEFADSGPGFSKAALARYAEIFFSEREGGMGIGLSVANEIVRAHGGKLFAENHKQGGAVVRVEL